MKIHCKQYVAYLMPCIVCSISWWVLIHSSCSWSRGNAQNDEHLSACIETSCCKMNTYRELMLKDTYLSAGFSNRRWKICIFQRVLRTHAECYVTYWELTLKDTYLSARVLHTSLSAEVTTAPKDTHLLARVSLPRSKILIFWRGCDFRAHMYLSAWVPNTIHAEWYLSLSISSPRFEPHFCGNFK